jgi:hypothetical protein
MLTTSRCEECGRLRLRESVLANVLDGPSMLDVFQAWFSPEGFEARFLAAQQNDTRALFLKSHMARIGKELAYIEMKINEAKPNL